MSNHTSDPGGQDEPAARPGETRTKPLIRPSCRAQAIGTITEFAECLIQPSEPCAYRVPFGLAFFCWHPAHSEIVAQTRRQK